MNALADMLTTWGTDILLANHGNRYLDATAYAMLRLARRLYR